jgi:hypothetical protein
MFLSDLKENFFGCLRASEIASLFYSKVVCGKNIL